jgi:hypothetical protein
MFTTTDNDDVSEIAQDGHRSNLLCAACEQRLSVSEKRFSEEWFYPLHRGQVSRIQYGAWAGRFFVSVVWRALIVLSEDATAVTQLNRTQLASIAKATEKWRRLLLAEVRSPGYFEIHVVQVGTKSDRRDVNQFVHAAIEFNLAAHPQIGELSVLVKMGRLLVVGIIENPNPRAWRHTKVFFPSGEWGGVVPVVPSTLRTYLDERIAIGESHRAKPMGRLKRRG